MYENWKPTQTSMDRQSMHLMAFQAFFEGKLFMETRRNLKSTAWVDNIQVGIVIEKMPPQTYAISNNNDVGGRMNNFVLFSRMHFKWNILTFNN